MEPQRGTSRARKVCVACRTPYPISISETNTNSDSQIPIPKNHDELGVGGWALDVERGCGFGRVVCVLCLNLASIRRSPSDIAGFERRYTAHNGPLQADGTAMSDTPDARNQNPYPYRWVILAVGILAYGTSQFSRQNYAGVQKFIADRSWSRSRHARGDGVRVLLRLRGGSDAVGHCVGSIRQSRSHRNGHLPHRRNDVRIRDGRVDWIADLLADSQRHRRGGRVYAVDRWHRPMVSRQGTRFEPGNARRRRRCPRRRCGVRVAPDPLGVFRVRLAPGDAHAGRGLSPCWACWRWCCSGPPRPIRRQPRGSRSTGDCCATWKCGATRSSGRDS